MAYAPDGLGRPTQAGTFANTVSYAPNGAIAGLYYGNGMYFNQAFNIRQRVKATHYRLTGGGRLADRSLTYDANGNLTAITDTATAPGSDARTMQYDGLDRLTKLTSTGLGVSQYTYDPLGNVRSRQSSGVTTTFTYDATKNRIASQSGSVLWHYDDRGNVTQIGGFGFTWNRANEVTADTLGTTFAYDAHGWRVKQHVTAGGTHTRYFVYDAGHRLIERLDNGTATDFVYVGSKPIARRTGSTTTYVHGDEQNSPLFETSSAGAITRQPVYLGYGESDTVGIAEIPGYAGSTPDKETGINYMGARYYYAYVGRFLSPDPAELDPTTHIGLNRYAYANDNPVRFTDPDGWKVRLDIKSIGAGIDAVKIAVYLAKSPTAMGEFNQIVQSATTYKIVIDKSGGSGYSEPKHTVFIDTREGLKVESTDKIQSPAIGAAHEISHAAENDRIGDDQYRVNAWLDRTITVTPIPTVSPEEQRAVRVEDKVIDEVGESGHRESCNDTVEEKPRTCGATSTTQC